ncbi:glycine cleavage system aminomethyltransferase GcvT [Clostridium polynesiense]|uniref:glycine cleavage system aminomethyltransferase GcvT n=1 Tax=Clostridium polynesiense TaxID=1325933 RepID=UPI00059149FF|nr:glycine cleavage system aminomethyltransferase GcvT [Clostridium polynesiense]
MENLKKTPLCNEYEKYGGKVIDFAGWELPVEFEGIMAEHNTVRNAAGLFDVSHMGEISVKGKDAMKLCQHLLTNDLSKLKDNQVLYTFMCNESGGVVDDLLAYRFGEEDILLVVNASNTDKDYQWIKSHMEGYDAEVLNISEEVSQLALQGPKAQEILQSLTDTDLNEIKFFYARKDVIISGKNCMISRTGYTGEDGFEIYTKPEDLSYLWETILKNYEVRPIGLGARDTLRFESNLPLYGNELSDEITPLEAGFGFFVKLDKEEFIGKEALKEQKEKGLKRKIVGFEMLGRGIPRHGYKVVKDGKEIGHVTTGYLSPTLGKNIGFALVEIEHSSLDEEFEIQIRNKTSKAKIISRKFYVRNK